MKWEGFKCDICHAGPYEQSLAVVETTTVEADGEKRTFRRECCRECGADIVASLSAGGSEVTRRGPKPKAKVEPEVPQVEGI